MNNEHQIGQFNHLGIEDAIAELTVVLRKQSNAVLIAPPGAGKTTRIAPALLDEPWAAGRTIYLLSPRRLAARAAAERIAEELGVPIGGLVGYATRMDSKQSRDTRLLVVTQGIFRNLIQAAPDLPDVAAVLFDEVHERSLDGDFSLALALDAQGALRPDLRLLAMSATLDGGRFAALMGDAPLIECAARAHPLTVRHIGRDSNQRIENAMAEAISAALRTEAGGILAFLPGMGEINRTAEQLGDLGSAIMLHKLHGSLDPAAQRAAIRPEPNGKRKVVLATAIAETSLTLAGISVVIDSGLARRARYDRQAGSSRLATERVSQAAATQRAGRAARLGPGVVVRLWEEAATKGLLPFDPPEILESDLSTLLLDSALWGVRDPTTLAWLDPPPASALAEARSRLQKLCALDPTGQVTPHGKAMAALPLPPSLAHMMISAGMKGWQMVAGNVAMLASEYGLGGTDPDLSVRLRHWNADKGARASAARTMALGWARRVGGLQPSEAPYDPATLASCVALAWPERVAKRRSANGTDWISVGGRGYKLDPLSPLASAEWLAVAEAQGAAGGAYIRSAAPMTEALVLKLFADEVEQLSTIVFDANLGAARARLERRLGAIKLASEPNPAPNPEALSACLMTAVRLHGLALLPLAGAPTRLRQRAAFAGVRTLGDDRLLETLDDWLPTLISGRTRLDQIEPHQIAQLWEGLIGWNAMQSIERTAPNQFVTPAGSHHDIDYDAPGGPEITVRVQALYGLSQHPVIGQDHIPLTLSLTSPAGRPIQTTRDLPGFWAGSWRDVAKEMRGRYPKHAWPDDPAAASATLRTKRADLKSI